MTSSIRDFDFVDQLAMYACTAGGLLVVLVLIGALVLLGRRWLKALLIK